MCGASGDKCPVVLHSVHTAVWTGTENSFWLCILVLHNSWLSIAMCVYSMCKIMFPITASPWTSSKTLRVHCVWRKKWKALIQFIKHSVIFPPFKLLHSNNREANFSASVIICTKKWCKRGLTRCCFRTSPSTCLVLSLLVCFTCRLDGVSSAVGSPTSSPRFRTVWDHYPGIQTQTSALSREDLSPPLLLTDVRAAEVRQKAAAGTAINHRPLLPHLAVLNQWSCS